MDIEHINFASFHPTQEWSITTTTQSRSNEVTLTTIPVNTRTEKVRRVIHSTALPKSQIEEELNSVINQCIVGVYFGIDTSEKDHRDKELTLKTHKVVNTDNKGGKTPNLATGKIVYSFTDEEWCDILFYEGTRPLVQEIEIYTFIIYNYRVDLTACGIEVDSKKGFIKFIVEYEIKQNL